MYSANSHLSFRVYAAIELGESSRYGLVVVVEFSTIAIGIGIKGQRLTLGPVDSMEHS
ncbi:hypothetical protein M413DRAFT_441128 [Hebeloma cylindrosporum]|uniref:Uncharacterized protein n=1 Tax=Hebeloma cylindrosporum TaxID=76867 RepID=A0A0C3CB93_HEBCY|nr:hypothetical protein M413DRAFT_441128 [Hebeloma cylindrosporum h7]